MIRVLVVDDSSLVRKLIVTSLGPVDDIEVVGVGKDGLEALELVDRLQPDAVTLDIEMPNLDGLGALRRIRDKHPRLPVIMFSTLTERGATKTLEALGYGASDYVTKPSNTGSISESMEAVREQLVPKIRALTGARRLAAARDGQPRLAHVRQQPAPVRTTPAKRPEVLVVGCSTGGPDALTHVVAELPADLRVPVLVVQHMPPVFTTMFAERLNKAGALAVREAQQGDRVEPGTVLLAPGGFHMTAAGAPATGVRVELDQGPAVNFVRPAVDNLFESVARVYGGAALVLMLTGMGADGLAGTRILRGLGARVVVQDEESSVVWGMPGAVATAGLADEVLPLAKIGGYLSTALR